MSNNKKCMNCAHLDSSHFKIAGKTHAHCLHRMAEMERNGEEPNAWETLRTVFESCNNFEPKMKRMAISRVYPKGHPRAGQQTEFVEKIAAGLCSDPINGSISNIELLKDIHPSVRYTPKCLTLREAKPDKNGNYNARFAVGERVVLFFWEGLPYKSKQVEIGIVTISSADLVRLTPELDLVEVYGDGRYLERLSGENFEKLATLDGFTNTEEFWEWHNKPASMFCYGWVTDDYLR